MTRTQSHSSKSNHAPLNGTSIEQQSVRLKAAGREAFIVARRGVRGAARASVTFAKEHPVATTSALVGAALIIGAVAQRAFHHQETLGEVLKRTLAERADAMSRSFVTTTRRGLGSAARSLSQSLR